MVQRKKRSKQIPPPPPDDAPWEEQAAYHEKYDMEDLRKAGYLLPLDEQDKQFIAAVEAEARRLIAARKNRAQGAG